MSEGSSERLAAGDARIAKSARSATVPRHLRGERANRGLGRLSIERIDRAIEAFSRFAGPVTFIIVLSGVVFLVTKALV
jgi:hypothetical protein